ncbi:hypothetical protein [Brevifollis gellanilyticus]|uniref:Uncharacterized protein n=1 Tax=Brevifollis gellanilyticus TaxID=748831 RepID=A0A512M2Z3_9BACT|nr:hypothetical protein [Brevifollis gellanilyticus]GEP41109.1 hypothetical protein BGE01nite_04000 [Brevifollis gellanilyticus]
MSTRSSLKPIFWLTIVAWLITLVTTLIMRGEADWSRSMIRLQDLGFDYGGTSPIVALGLAGGQEGIDKLLPPHLKSGRHDRDVATAITQWDFAFIVGYASLFILLVLRQKKGALRSLQIGLVILGALLDVVENFELLAAIYRAPGWIPFLPKLLATAATVKWMALFLVFVLLGYAELTQSTYDTLPAFWRCLMGVLMLLGGVVGFWWMGGLHSGLLIQNGYAFAVASLAILPVRFFTPDGNWRHPVPEDT